MRLNKETLHLQITLERQEAFKAIAIQCGLIVERGKYVGEGNASALLSAIAQLPEPDKQKLIEMIQMAKAKADAAEQAARSEPLKLPLHKIYAFLGQKGGAGKSITSGHFAFWLKQQGISILFVDADGQASASPWMKALEIPVVQITDPEELIEALPLLANEHETVIVDGPGNAGEITKAILTRCDIAIVPNRPSDFDLRSANKIVQFIKHVQDIKGGLPQALFFANAVKSERSVLLREAREALGKYKLPLAKKAIRDLTCIADAPGQRTTVFAMKTAEAMSVAQDYEALFLEIVKELTHG